MVRISTFLVVLFALTSLFSQENNVQQGLIRASATISPSSMLNRSVSNIYLNGHLEYFLSRNLSLRGETFFFVDGHSKNGSPNVFIDQAIRTYFGAFIHTTGSNWDKYVGLQPGISIIKPIGKELKACPSFSLHSGSTYYIWKYFNFFVDIAYVNSTYRGLMTGSAKTDEVILSAGLGFQIPTGKKH